MENPWSRIELADYETHMASEGVCQLQVLSHVMAEQLSAGAAEVALLGAAGGNGLEHIDPRVVRKVWALDINGAYLDACQERFSALGGVLETARCDLTEEGLMLPRCDLAICNLIVEYLGVPCFAGLIGRSADRLKRVSCVIQRNNGASFVSASGAAERLSSLDALHRDVDEQELAQAMAGAGFPLRLRQTYALPNGKEFIRMDFEPKQEDGRPGLVTQSKAWDWDIGKSTVWLKPCEESYYLAWRWREQGRGTVLDLGCGLGRHSIHFAKHGFSVSACDLSEMAVAHLDEWKQRENLAIDTTVCDMLNLPYGDGQFDCLFAYHVISHTDTKGFDKLVGELDRVLKPGGEFYITLCSKESWSFGEAGYPRIDENSVWKTEGAELDVPHFYVSLDDIERLLKRFDLIKIRHTDDCYFEGQRRDSKHYFILGGKKAVG